MEHCKKQSQRMYEYIKTSFHLSPSYTQINANRLATWESVLDIYRYLYSNCKYTEQKLKLDGL